MGKAKLDPIQAILDRSLRKERSLPKKTMAAAIQAKAEAEPQEPPLPKLSGPPDHIARMRAVALRVPPGDLTPNVLGDLYHDAVARGLVEGVNKPRVTLTEEDAWFDERRELGRVIKIMANARKWAMSKSFWKCAEIECGGDLEDYSDMFEEDKEAGA
jgi:hypothetical protein